MDNFFQTDLDALGFVDELESATTRAITRESRKGTYVTSDEVCAKISTALKGRKLRAEHRAKISAARKGRKHNAETLAKIGAAHKGGTGPFKGYTHSTEARAKISAASKKRGISAETRAKMLITREKRKEQV